MRVSRLTPFSRSQNSNPAKKSAFIGTMWQPFPLHPANKKVGKTFVSDFRTLASQQQHRFNLEKLKILFTYVKCKFGQTTMFQGRTWQKLPRLRAIRILRRPTGWRFRERLG